MRLLTIIAIALLGALQTTTTSAEEAGPDRFMPFLGRSAVVKELGAPVTLAGQGAAGAPVLMLGRDTLAGPRADFENAQIRQAASILSRYLEKITGVRCLMPSAGGAALNDGSFEEPPTIQSPNPLWPALSGGWITYLNRTTTASVSLDATQAHEGKRSLTASGSMSPTGMAGAYRSLALVPGKQVRLSLWYRTSIEGAGTAWVSMPRQQPEVQIALPPAPQWTHFEQVITPSQAEALLQVGIRGSDRDDNRVWFDLVTLEPDTGTSPAASARGMTIRLGIDGDLAQAFPELASADAHGFVIAQRDGELHIVGRSGTGTLFGVWFFLQNYAGLRMVMPGELGEVYAKLQSLTIPGELYVFNPAPDFLLRIWSQRGFDRSSWLQDYSGTERFLYHHPWSQLLPSEKFGQSSPELYPVLGGKRFIPPAASKAGMWQPTFSEPKLVDHVAARADELFAANPGLMSISLSVNDGQGYSELDMTDGLEGWRRHYFNFVNAAAQRLAQKHPGKFAALLSYGDAAAPPPFKLADNVMLFIFSYQGNIRDTCEQWKGAVSRFGVYQWLYGAGWVIPNHWPHAMQDYLRYLRGIGGTAFKGEANIGFAQDGARQWVLANLLWNVDADVEAILNDYYQHCYGKEAAPFMARYFARAEAIYERRRTPTQHNLTRHRVGAYQFEHVTDADMAAMSDALSEADKVVQGEANRARLQYTRHCFEFGRLYWQAHQALRRFQSLCPEGGGDATNPDALLAAGQEFMKAVHAIPLYQAEHLAKAPEGVCYGTQGHEFWLGAGFKWHDKYDLISAAFDQVTAQRRKTEPPQKIVEFWNRVAQGHPDLKLFADEQCMDLAPAAAPGNLLSNGSFEKPADPADAEQSRLLERYRAMEIRNIDFNDQKFPGLAAHDWVAFERNGISFTAARDTSAAREGGASLRIAGAAYYGGVSQHFVPPQSRGRYRLSFWYRTSGAVGTPICRVNFYKGWGFETSGRSLSASAQWQLAQLEFTVNGPPQEAPVTITLLLQNSQPDAAAWFDDVRVECLSVSEP